MGKFIKVEEYSPESTLKSILFVNPEYISLIMSQGIYTLIVLSSGKEIKVEENVHLIHRMCKKTTKKFS